MDTMLIEIEGLLKIKIHANDEVYCNLKKRFVDITKKNEDSDYEIIYKKTESIKKMNNGEVMNPFRNSVYLVTGDNDKIIAYSPKQQYSDENLIIREGKQIYVYCSEDPNDKILVRIITELMIRKLLENGFFPLHASSVLKEEKSLLFMGKKGSGKSTALFSNILLNNSKLISNDITFVGKTNGEWKVYGLPYDITFDEDLFYQIDNGMEMIQKSNREENYGSNKIRFNILEFINVFNTSFTWSAPISKISIVNLSKDNPYNEIENIDYKDGLYALKNYGKDKGFIFDDFLKINNLYPNFNYDILSKEVSFNKMEGNILKHYLRR